LSTNSARPHIAYLAPEYGTLSSTFVYREVEELRKRGWTVSTFSTTLKHSGSVFSREVEAHIRETEYLFDVPASQLMTGAWAQFFAAPAAFSRAKAAALHDAAVAQTSFTSDRPKVMRHFLLGCYLAKRLRLKGIQHIHAHFAHVPTAIAMYGAMAAGISYSFTAHANDIFVRAMALREKVRRAAFVAVISEYNRRFLADLGCDPRRMHIVRCGIDAEAFQFAPRSAKLDAEEPPHIVTVCRMVPKKGIPQLVKALALLRDRGGRFRCTIVGDGPQMGLVRSLVEEQDLGGSVELVGPAPQERVREYLAEADVFVLPCMQAPDGDMDGIPVAYMEAMALGVPVCATAVSGIPELIHHGESGVLASAGDPSTLADALEELLTDADRRARLAQGGRARIEAEFTITRNVDILQELFAQAIENRGRAVPADE
jgi:glycosyltransferase involved in cell wall biosynthesis